MSTFKSTTVFDCVIHPLKRINDPAGNLTVVTGKENLPFDVKRVFYLYDVPSGQSRGGHAHYTLQQLVVAASGSFDMLLDDGVNKKIVTLNRPNYGLYVAPGIWGELLGFSSGSVSLVLASDLYVEADYIREYDAFVAAKDAT